MKRLLAFLACVSSAATALTAPGVVHAAPMPACPATVVVAARGATERVLPPETLSNGAVVDEWDGIRIRGLLRMTPLHNASVMTLDPAAYPALPALLTPVGGLHLGALIGAVGLVGKIAAYEKNTGCHPRYVLVGYSEGAMAVQLAEKTLADSGRLQAVLTIATPWAGLGDGPRIGSTQPRVGSLSWPVVGSSSEYFRAPGIDVLEYCFADDLVCSFTGNLIGFSRPETTDIHLSYFIHPEEHTDRQVAQWLGKEIAKAENAGPAPAPGPDWITVSNFLAG